MQRELGQVWDFWRELGQVWDFWRELGKYQGVI